MNSFPKTTIGFYFKHGIKPFFWTLLIWFILAVAWRLSDGILIPYLTKLFLALFENPISADITPWGFAGQVVFGIGLTLLVAHIVHLCDDVLWIRLRTRVSNHLSEILNEYVHNQSMSFWSGRIVGKTNEQVAFLSKGFDFLVMIVVTCATFVVVAVNFGMILNINPKIGFVFGAAILFYFTYCILRMKSLNDVNKIAAKSYSSLAGQLIDSLSNFQAVKLFARAKHEKIFVRNARNQHIKDKVYAGMMERFFWGVPAILWAIAFSVMLYLCVDMYLIGEMKVSEIAFTLTVNAVVMGSVSGIVSHLPRIAELIGSASQSYQELIAPISVQDVPNAPELSVSRGAIEIQNVNFKYNKKLVLDNLSLSIKPGEKVGLVGTSGAGKTTLVNLLMRLYDPVHGAIYIDGQDIREVTQDSLRENIAFIPQDTTLFNRNIRENIAYGKIGATDAEIKSAAKKSSADKFIMETPNRYDTLVGDRGIKLSGGQRQRIAIARAFLKDAPILILDEATAALDSETETVIQKSFDELSRGRTTIAIAHRLSTLRNMDRIVVIDRGEIVEMGTHNTLVRKRNGIYARLWKMQSGGFIQE